MWLLCCCCVIHSPVDFIPLSNNWDHQQHQQQSSEFHTQWMEASLLFLSLPCWMTWWRKHCFLCDLLSIHGCRHEWKYAAFLPFYVSGSWFPSHWSSALWGHSCIFYLCFDLILTSDRHLQSTPASTLDISTSFTLWTLVSNHINVCFLTEWGWYCDLHKGYLYVSLWD